MSDTTTDEGTSDERVRYTSNYGHALRVLAVLLRNDTPKEVIAERIERIAEQVDTE